MIAPENPYFAKVIVNRVWAEIMGRGIVDPVDDLRATNPPSNGPLLDALADDFRRHGYDLKHLIGTILSSSVYAPQLRAERAERRRHAQLLPPLPAAAAGRGPARRDLGRDRRARHLRGRPARLARRGDLDAPGPLAVPRHVRPARPEPGPALRAHQRHVGRPGAAPDERARAAQEGHQRRRPRRAARRRQGIAARDRRGTLLARRTPGCRPTRSWPSGCRSSRARRPTAARRSKTCCGHCSTRRSSSSKIDRDTLAFIASSGIERRVVHGLAHELRIGDAPRLPAAGPGRPDRRRPDRRPAAAGRGRPRRAPGRRAAS